MYNVIPKARFDSEWILRRADVKRTTNVGFTKVDTTKVDTTKVDIKVCILQIDYYIYGSWRLQKTLLHTVFSPIGSVGRASGYEPGGRKFNSCMGFAALSVVDGLKMSLWKGIHIFERRTIICYYFPLKRIMIYYWPLRRGSVDLKIQCYTYSKNLQYHLFMIC
jgi:hypothetical protein